MNFKDTTRHKVVGYKSEIKAVTTAAIIIYPGLPSRGLRQSIHNPTILLSVYDIFATPTVASNDLSLQILRHLIVDAIKKVYRSSVK